MSHEFYLWIALAINIVGWFFLHFLSKRRDFKNKKKEIRINYLIKAWRLLEDASNRSNNDKNQNIESAIADIQLLGTQKQIVLAQKIATEISTNGTGYTLDILTELRADLRKELGLEKVENFKFLRFSYDKPKTKKSN